MKTQRGSRSIVLFFLTSELDERGWSKTRPGRFTPGKETRYPLYSKLFGCQGWSVRVRKNSPSLRFDPWTVQSVPSRYTDYAIPAHFVYQTLNFITVSTTALNSLLYTRTLQLSTFRHRQMACLGFVDLARGECLRRS